MAEFKVALGGVFDVASGEELRDSITGLQGHIDRQLSAGKMQPIRKPLSQSTNLTLASGATQTLALGKPPMGKVWSVASVTILGADDGTSVANLKASVYVGDEIAVSLSQCVIPQQSIPFFDTFGYPDIWVHDQNKLYVNFTATGAVAGQVVVGNAWIMEYDDCAVEAQRI